MLPCLDWVSLLFQNSLCRRLNFLSLFFPGTPQLMKAGQMKHPRPRHAGLWLRGCSEAAAARRDAAVMNGRDRKAEICRDTGSEDCSLSFKRSCLQPALTTPHLPLPLPHPCPSAAVATSFVCYLNAPLLLSLLSLFSSPVQFSHCHTNTSATFPGCRFFIFAAWFGSNESVWRRARLEVSG